MNLNFIQKSVFFYKKSFLSVDFPLSLRSKYTDTHIFETTYENK